MWRMAACSSSTLLRKCMDEENFQIALGINQTVEVFHFFIGETCHCVTCHLTEDACLQHSQYTYCIRTTIISSLLELFVFSLLTTRKTDYQLEQFS